MNRVDAIQILAFRDFMLQTPEFKIRAICRWYSQTFSTPLHFVEKDIPLESILTHYFEHTFETAERDTLEELKKLLLETDEQREVRLRSEDAIAADNEEVHRLLEEEAKARSVKTAKSPNIPVINVPIRKAMMMPEPRLPETLPTQLPPDIEMHFVTPEELDRKLEEFGAVPVPARQS